MENLACFDLLFAQLELKQLFAIQAKIERQISNLIKEKEIPEMEVAKLKHQAINKKTVTNG